MFYRLEARFGFETSAKNQELRDMMVLGAAPIHMEIRRLERKVRRCTCLHSPRSQSACCDEKVLATCDCQTTASYSRCPTTSASLLGTTRRMNTIHQRARMRVTPAQEQAQAQAQALVLALAAAVSELQQPPYQHITRAPCEWLARTRSQLHCRAGTTM